MQRPPEAHAGGVLAHAEAEAAVREGLALQQAQRDDPLLRRGEPGHAGADRQPDLGVDGALVGQAAPRVLAVARAPCARARPSRSCRRRAAAPRGRARRACWTGGRQREATSRSTNTSCVRSSARSELPVRYASPVRPSRAAPGRPRRRPRRALPPALPPCRGCHVPSAGLPTAAGRPRRPTQASASRASPTPLLGDPAICVTRSAAQPIPRRRCAKAHRTCVIRELSDAAPGVRNRAAART